jgi:hypothetical protein
MLKPLSVTGASLSLARDGPEKSRQRPRVWAESVLARKHACSHARLSVSHATPLSPRHIGVQRRGALERPAGRRHRRADYASERGRNLNPNPRPASATPIEACWQSIGSVFPPPCTRLREGNRVGQTGSQRQAAQLCPSSSACGVCVRVRERARERGSAEKRPGSG